MSAVEERTKTTTRHEYIIPRPACWTDVKMAMHLAAQAREEAGLRNDYDDVIKLDADDTHIIIFWEDAA